ncbi:AAA family ATPase [Fimbriimonas ginsengisoli]|uniref:SMC protein-like protein n=1 Tax=Fimbriimonas ginsengisoli Gsoil 348 TaxID=661478 RepID=A0A068NPL7_FIMGI|nr:AAA family ATPase [Fimbriimonas ginsengisoli]AIE85322.1 SMC protein-like protein [Fimbriimonas ginsengisoli Gsoil 348]
MRPRPTDREPFIHSIELARERVPSFDRYPFSLPAVQGLTRLKLHPAVTFFIGENGAGKSTLIEGIAVRLGFDEGGGEAGPGLNHRPPDGGLHDALRINSSRNRRAADRFFLRAETVFDLASDLDRREKADPSARDWYGEASLHTRSHGEAFLAIVQNRMRSESIFLLDEPEAALSPTRQLTLLKEVDWLVRSGCQFLIATHSPILMSYPDALIYEMGEFGIRETTYKETEHYQITKSFLDRPESFLRHLIE